MSKIKRVFLVGLGVMALAGVGLGTLATLNWDTVSGDVSRVLEEQTEKAQITLFRLGELMSIGARLNEEFGSKPEMDYQTGSGRRLLRIAFTDYELPEQTIAEDHAREIAVFAVAATTKSDEIDAVSVSFPTGPYIFALDEL